MSATVLTGATLVDVVDGRHVERSVVIVNAEGVITTVGSEDTIPIPREACVIDAAGLTLLPGLVDCHAHPALREAWLTGAEHPDPTDLVVGALEAGRRWAEHGVTTVRDAWGATAGMRRAFASGAFIGPRLQISTGPLRSGAQDLAGSPAGLLFPSRPELPMGTADGPDAVRREVRCRIAAGADWIKIFACGWSDTAETGPGGTQFTVEELRVAADEAAAAGIRGVMAHTQGPASIANALAAGIRSIEHGDLLDEETIDRMLRLDAVLVVQGPTGDTPDAAGLINGLTPVYWEAQRRHITAAAEAGVRIVLGSDVLGEQLPHAGVAHLATCGLGPLGAVRAATIEGARLLGLAGETGSIEVGKRADLLLMNGDPVADPFLWRDPGRVVMAIVGGRVAADRR